MKKLLILCSIILFIARAAVGISYAAGSNGLDSPDFFQYVGKIFSEDSDENAAIAAEKMEDEKKKFDDSIVSEGSSSPEAEYIPVEKDKVFSELSDGIITTHLPGGDLTQDSKSICWNGVPLVAALPGDEDNQVKAVSISPDAKYVYYIQSAFDKYGNCDFYGGILLLSPDEAKAMPLEFPVRIEGGGNECSWSANGNYAIIAAAEDTVLIKTSDASCAADGLTYHLTALSPDEKTLAYWRRNESTGVYELFTRDVGADKETMIASLPESPAPYLPPMGPFWCGNDRILFNTGEAVIIDSKYRFCNRVLAVDTATRETAEFTLPEAASDIVLLGLSHDGRYALIDRGESAQVAVADLQTGTTAETSYADSYYSYWEQRCLWDPCAKCFVFPEAIPHGQYTGKLVEVRISPDGSMQSSAVN